jgi:hypothetical protein
MADYVEVFFHVNLIQYAWMTFYLHCDAYVSHFDTSEYSFSSLLAVSQYTKLFTQVLFEKISVISG